MRFGRPHKLASLVLFSLIVLITVATQSGWLGNTATQKLSASQPDYYQIARYVDGDTIDVNMNGSVETIRFIGVDTPETHKPNTPVQCYGPVAATYTQSRISVFGKVRLQADPLDTNRDRYGRLLRYVYLPDGTLLDEDLIKTGHGFAYLGFPFEKSALFAADQSQAQAQKIGLWRDCQPIVNQYGGYTSNPTKSP